MKGDTFEARLAIALPSKPYDVSPIRKLACITLFSIPGCVWPDWGVLETAEHLHLRPNSAAVEFQRVFHRPLKNRYGCTDVFELDIRVACDSFG